MYFFFTIQWQFPSHSHFQRTKAKNKTCGLLFSLWETTDEKQERERNIPGGGDSSEALKKPNATNLCFTGVWHSARWDVAAIQGGRAGQGGVWGRGGRRERENERKWQQMKLASCGVLFPSVHSNEQTLTTDWGNWSPEGPGSFHLSGVLATQRDTHPFLWTHTSQSCMNISTSRRNSKTCHAVFGRCIFLCVY